MKEYESLKIGQQIKDNDPRVPGRVLTIAEIFPNGVVAKNTHGHAVTILRRRIYTDGKPRRNGFDLLRGENA